MARLYIGHVESEELLLQKPLEFDVQLNGAQRTPMRWRQHLDVADQVIAEPFLENFGE